MPSRIVGKLYAVFRSDEDTSEDDDVLMTTKDAQEALGCAKEHQGVLYRYEVTDYGDLVNETRIEIDDTPS